MLIIGKLVPVCVCILALLAVNNICNLKEFLKIKDHLWTFKLQQLKYAVVLIPSQYHTVRGVINADTVCTSLHESVICYGCKA